MGPENLDGFEGLILHRHFYGGLEGFHWESGQGIGRPGERRRGVGEGRSVPVPVHPTFTVGKRCMQDLEDLCWKLGVSRKNAVP
jgi:hypothetical protein